MVSVVQLSDLHVTEAGVRGYGGLAPDTGESFAAVVDHAYRDLKPDLTVVTGDIAEDGLPAQYEIALERLVGLSGPTTVVPGNHDFDIPFQVGLASTAVSMNRAEHHGAWLFVYLDSNHDGRCVDDTGRLIDAEDRIEANGLLGAAEVSWVDDLIAASKADHVWLWMHHAPGAGGLFAQPEFTGEVAGLIGRNPRIRGISAGHTHTNEQPTVAGRPVHICPSLTLNFDVENWTTLPPGYRTYEFGHDGEVRSELHLLDGERWPRLPLPDPAIAVLRGEISWSEGMAQLGLGGE